MSTAFHGREATSPKAAGPPKGTRRVASAASRTPSPPIVTGSIPATLASGHTVNHAQSGAWAPTAWPGHALIRMNALCIASASVSASAAVRG